MKRLSANIKGVTLIELIIVLAIIAISAAIAIPGMSGWMAKTKLNAETRKLYSVFQLARSEAIKNNQNVTVDIVKTLNFGTCTYSCYYGNPIIYIIPVTQVPENIRLNKYNQYGVRSTSASSSTWTFTTRGSCLEGDVPDYLGIESNALPPPKNEKFLRVSLGGSVTIQ